ncbi:MAG: hypothetical protein B7Y08_21875 [Rhodospirillales bacterium 24-66-33]|jgi:hypothetical protein|uniref:hypothetical protein n=1 Tax=Reyranella sp. TaxID=1929291 RepID=UPI000BC74208|nr:MAG: hypothetical protein B7Y57_19405 [Rhodospirillales bacterium 35-66-84]OYZ92401.1 MAG: hypothetical protein B7Y08_21875 [Rhodospirillales bacterium 24-66-33]OZB22133.1 MAG: hypothetical protein B7X63_23850 [Rhodospirillales bacterium 39-66-50]
MVQVCSRDDGWPEPIFEKQVQLAFDNLVEVLSVASCTFDDVTTFHTDSPTEYEGVTAFD